jgi:hypothetical protein
MRSGRRSRERGVVQGSMRAASVTPSQPASVTSCPEREYRGAPGWGRAEPGLVCPRR